MSGHRGAKRNGKKKIRGRESLFGACGVALAARDVEGALGSGVGRIRERGPGTARQLLAKAVPRARHMAKRRERRVSWRSEW